MTSLSATCTRRLSSAAQRGSKKRLLARMDRGEAWTFDEIVRELRIPLDVVIGGFVHSFHKKYGIALVPVGRAQ